MSSNVAVISEEQLREAIREVVRDEVSRAFADLAERAPGNPTPDDLLTREDLAALLRIDVRTLRRLILEREVPPPLRLGDRTVRWRRSTVISWLTSLESRLLDRRS